MRAIKFRGQREDNGEWVYGYYFVGMNDTHWIVTSEFIFTPIQKGMVGQFTGLLDKNGTEIYEGDIVREHANDYTPIYQNGIYMAYNVDKINDPYVSTQFNVIWRNGCKVIGNIHDNKEIK